MADPLTAAATVADLAQLLAGTRITSLTLATPAETITLYRHAGSVPGAASQLEPPGATLSAPCSGTFRHRHPLRDAPLVRVGQAIQAGTVLGLLEVGPLLLPITALQAGTVVTLAPEGMVVGYGTTLVEVT